MTQIKIKLTGLTCGACQKVISNRIHRIPDVQDVQVDLSGDVTISATREISQEEVKKVLENTPYQFVNNL